MGHKLGQLVSLNLFLDTKESKKWKLLLKRQQWPQISEIEDPKREKKMILKFSLIKDIEKKWTHILELGKVKISRLLFGRGWFFKLFGRHFQIRLDRLYLKRLHYSLGWFVTRCYNSKPKCFSCIFVKFCNDQNQISAFRLYRDSDFWWNEIKSVNLICLLHTSWIQLLPVSVSQNVSEEIRHRKMLYQRFYSKV